MANDDYAFISKIKENHVNSVYSNKLFFIFLILHA